MDNDKPIFALDIGTRSVVGLIVHKNETGYHVKEMIRKEHKERSMIDGQIHNVIAVSKIIEEIKQLLEEKCGPLKSVCVAAAGRSLKTMRGKETIRIEGKPLSKEDVLHLELSAVQKAQYLLAKQYEQENEKIDVYCVGYSVLQYCLDDEPIGSLVEQKGNEASVEVIATFLPKVVVESLTAALDRANLEIEALTLEPIAAIHVLIPSSMRRLNVALVDIGAGTSDIAITNFGTVVAYGMVPVAGDEITEALSDQFLLDFPEAERVKRELSVNKMVTFTDILGMEATFNRDEIIDQIDETIDSLANHISNEILQLNHKPPRAVMLVGGGSMTPRLQEKIAEKLNLPKNRVATRGLDAIKDVTYDESFDSTPELVTPIGIAIAANENPVEYIHVTVNGQKIKLFDMKQLTVGDSLLSSGIQMSKLYGRPGMGMFVTVNDKIITVRGEHGTPPEIKKNGQLAKLDDPVYHDDVIEVKNGKDGKDAKAIILDFFDNIPKKEIIFNGERKQMEPIVLKNNEKSSLYSEVRDRDIVRVYPPKTVKEVLEQLNIPLERNMNHVINVTINGEEVSMSRNNDILLLNNKQAKLNDFVNNGDKLTYKKGEKVGEIVVEDILRKKIKEYKRVITVTFNGEPVQLEKTLYDIYRDKEKLPLDGKVYDGDELILKKKADDSFIFQDVFAKVTITQPEDKNKKPVILRNNEETGFSATIMHGDQLELRWMDLD